MTFRRRSLATFAVTLLGFGLATDASPATTVPGDLDVSFSGDGRQTADFGGLDAGRPWRSRATAKSWSPGARAGTSLWLATAPMARLTPRSRAMAW